MEKLFITFAAAVATCGAFYLTWLFIVELFKEYGTVSIVGLIAFIGVWVVWYLIID